MTLEPGQVMDVWVEDGSQRLAASVCGECGALVPAVSSDRHDDWHRSLSGV